MVALELLAPITCAASIALALPQPKALWSACAAMLVLFPVSALLSPQLMWRPWGHARSGKGGYFGFMADFPPEVAGGGALVAVTGDDPVAFVVPYFPRTTAFVRLAGSLFYESPGFAGLHQNSDEVSRRRVFGNGTGSAICRRLEQQSGPLYILRTHDAFSGVDRAALAYCGLALQPENCLKLNTKAPFTLSPCPASRTDKPECSPVEADNPDR